MLITVQKKLTKKELKADAKQAKAMITAWFEAHPRRRKCNANIFYNDITVVHKNTINEDIDSALNAVIASGRYR